MSSKRRLGAVAALVGGLFAALALLPTTATGPVGAVLGRGLWNILGAGAIGIPLLGFGIALAGLDRTPRLDMKRSALLMAGLSFLVPYLIGVLSEVTRADLSQVPEPGLAARATGWLPGFFAITVRQWIGVAGAFLLGFLALSALTLYTFQWHPLQRLERREEEAGDAEEPAPPRRRRVAFAGADAAIDAVDPVVEPAVPAVEPPRPERPKPKKPAPAKPAAKEPTAAQRAAIEEESELPPVALLAEPPERDVDAGEAQLDRLGQRLVEALRTFKVDCSVAGRTTGPVVTQFEVVPGPGVKAGRIVSLADDLAITMRAPSIRVAPIPGKGAVGVEIPNPVARIVTLREVLESGEWARARATLPVVLGRDLEGRAIVADLARMPHLLIAGATGSGKSVAINTIITSLIYRYTPKDLRFLMVDPKMVELSIYNALPHLRHKVVTNNHDAAAALKWAVFEMNRRYELLQANSARNLHDFNRKLAEGKPLRNPPRPQVNLTTISAEAPDTPPAPEQPEQYTEGPLPYIVVVVDELADLMMTVQGEVETPLAMLAQKARAIGIHLILATQRPSVNVITGLIKANFPSRIAFKVASKVDSRTILDGNGAEALLGNGDLLFLPPGKNEPMRIQGAFIGTDETEAVMKWYADRRAARKEALEAEPVEADILAMVREQEGEGDGAPGEGGAEDRDALFRDAAEACIQNQGGSTSLLQRRLRIGYGRAARIIDQLHFAGILGPPDGSRPREVLIGFDQLDEYTR
jgi:S-DNA-T family DNA segregation ATPase FtsK/SpoIIIE